jgi:hypothetical protein
MKWSLLSYTFLKKNMELEWLEFIPFLPVFECDSSFLIIIFNRTNVEKRCGSSFYDFQSKEKETQEDDKFWTDERDPNLWYNI